MKYRPDIDGIRAIAVLSVILYHVDHKLLPGGFIGVDIFFVISGYLITKLIKDEVFETGKFSQARFYSRRIRRLAPALIFVVFTTLLAGYLLAPPILLRGFAAEAIPALIGISNFYYLTTSGYFGAETIQKIFLHTWSLGVEEQYYLLWPFFVLFIARLGQDKIKNAFLAAILLISFFLAVFTDVYSMGIANWVFSGSDTTSVTQGIEYIRSASFFMMPFRIYEFLLGGVLCFLPQYRWGHRISDLASFAAFLTLFFSFLLMNEKLFWPSYWALIPCAATATLIYCAHTSRLRIFLTNPISVFTGKISYSLYLWHWPVIVIFQAILLQRPDLKSGALIFVVSYILACLTYFFVETPFRNGRWLPFKTGHMKIVGGWALLTGSLLFVPYRLLAGDPDFGGNTDKETADSDYWVQPYIAPENNPTSERLKEIGKGHASYLYPSPTQSLAKILIIGDSHAGRLLGFAESLANRFHLDVYLHWTPCWMPLIGTRHLPAQRADKPEAAANCDRPDGYWDFVHEQEFDVIVLSSRYASYLEEPIGEFSNQKRRYFVDNGTVIKDRGEGYAIFQKALSRSIDFLLPRTHAILLISQAPPTSRNLVGCDEVPASIFSEDEIASRCRGANSEDVHDYLGGHVEAFDIAAERSNVYAIHPIRAFCRKGEPTCTGRIKDQVLYNDSHHLSRYGAYIFFDHFEQYIARLLQDIGVDVSGD